MGRASTLFDFFDHVGLSHFRVSANDTLSETLGDYQRSQPLSVAQLTAITANACLGLYAAFGDALSLRITSSMASIDIKDEILTTTPGEDQNANICALSDNTQAPLARSYLASALQEMAGFDGSLSMKINKTRVINTVLRERGWDNSTTHFIYYLFTQYLVGTINSEGVGVFDSGVFVAKAKPTITIIADSAELFYQGDLLTIISEERLANVVHVHELVRTDLAPMLCKYQSTVQERLSLDFRLRHVTPLHLICRNVGVEDLSLTKALQRELFHLSVLYTANRSQRRGLGTENGDAHRSYLVAFYNDQHRSTRVALSPDDEILADSTALTDFAQWPYSGEGRSDDRLDVLQKTVAQALLAKDADENTRTLVQNLSPLLIETRNQYSYFINDQLDDFYKQRQAISDYVADVAKKVAESVESVTKGLIDTGLATVAAAAAAIIAAVGNDKLRGSFFTALLVAYAVYVCVQAIYRLLGATHSISLLHSETTVRIASAFEQLGERTIKPLNDLLTRRWKQFRRWCIATAIAYAIIALLIALLGVKGPEYAVLKQDSISPSPTAQQTATPAVSLLPPSNTPNVVATPVSGSLNPSTTVPIATPTQP